MTTGGGEPRGIAKIVKDLGYPLALRGESGMHNAQQHMAGLAKY